MMTVMVPSDTIFELYFEKLLSTSIEIAIDVREGRVRAWDVSNLSYTVVVMVAVVMVIG